MTTKYRGKYVSGWMTVKEMDGTFSVLRLLGRGIMAKEERMASGLKTKGEADCMAAQLNN